jgi:hypothetical protein
MYPSVKTVTPSEDFILAIDFDNGEHGILDMKPYLDFGVFRQLKDRNTFKRVRVTFDTLEWDAGIDLDPEFVYEKCQRLHSSTSHRLQHEKTCS